MKLCYLADANSIHTKKICDFFVKEGYEVSCISLNKGEIPGVKVYSMDEDPNSITNSLKKVTYLNKINKIKKIVEHIKPDIVHAHYASSYGLIAALLNYKPLVLSVWGSDVYDFPKKSILHKSILRFNLKKADYILSTSNVMKVETEKYTKKDIIVTPFGVDINKFKPSEYKKNDNNIIIGTIKSLEEKYGIEYLIRAFKIVVDSNPTIDFKLIIGGKGSQLEYLTNLSKELEIENLVDFIGFIDQVKVVDTLQKFDIAAFPSTLDSESFGVAAVEAQACGIPVVVTDVDGLLESTVPGKTSLVAKRKSVDDLAEKLNILVRDSKLRDDMGKNGRDNVIKNYNVIDNFNIIKDLYEKLLKN